MPLDPSADPYTPSSGMTPPVLAGRDQQERDFTHLLGRLERGRAAQGIVVTGLRGVGKTVLLQRFEQIAEEEGHVVRSLEMSEDRDFSSAMGRTLYQLSFDLSSKVKASALARRLAAFARSLRPTVHPDGSVTFEVGQEGVVSDHIDLSADVHSILIDRLVTIGKIARDAKRGVVLLCDEAHRISSVDLSALVMALHRCAQLNLPVALVGAGLPQLIGSLGRAGTHTERMFRYVSLGGLAPESALVALRAPASQEGIRYEDDAAGAIVDYTEGYPYFIQVFGSMLWQLASGHPFTVEEVMLVEPAVERVLDDEFFATRLERVTSVTELRYLRAMAELPPGGRSSGAIATRLGLRSSSQVGAVRRKLIDKGMIYAPQVGMAEFTVPLFDRYMVRRRSLEPMR